VFQNHGGHLAKEPKSLSSVVVVFDDSSIDTLKLNSLMQKFQACLLQFNRFIISSFGSQNFLDLKNFEDADNFLNVLIA
jgi:hypothetical protein